MCIVSMKTMTQAQKGRKAMRAIGVEGEIVSLDKNLTRNGCAYGISFSCSRSYEVLKLLEERGINYGQMIGAGR